MLDTVETGVDEGLVLVDRYRVIRTLGTGGMATVYLAEDLVLGRRVAVKRMRNGGSTNERRFRREARLGATLNHPNVVTVFDTVAGEDGVLIVMEYVEGETLAEALPLEPPRALEVLRGVAEALDHAHAQGVVHRDVKPANVLLSPDGTVKLADLGIATAAEATQITNAHDVVGTLPYIAPERLAGASNGGPAADVYGLSVLAYELLSGRRPDCGATPSEVLRRTATGAPPDLREAWPQAPPLVAAVLAQGMSRDPAQRPGGAVELIDRLERAFGSAESEAPPIDLPPPPTVRAARARSAQREVPPTAEIDRLPPTARGRLVVGALGGLAIALVALAIAVLGGDGEAPNGEAVRAGGEDGSQQSAGAASGGAEAEGRAVQGPAGGEGNAGKGGADVDSGRGASLNRRGYELIQQGRPEEAIPVLQRSLRAFPDGTSELDYAYALFNLGNALRLAGRPEEAIPILERRLEIPNQRGTVRQELERARAEAGDGGGDDEQDG